MSEDNDYIDLEEISISLKTQFDEYFITENDLDSAPVIKAYEDTEGISIYMPFFLAAKTGNNADKLTFSENQVHTRLSEEDAEQLLEQLQDALE